MKHTHAGLALIAGQSHAAMEVAVASFKEMAEGILANDCARIQSAAERMARQAEIASMHGAVIARLAREMRTQVRRVA